MSLVEDRQSGPRLGFAIGLLLVDLSQDLQDDASAEQLPARLDSILDTLACGSAEAILSPPSQSSKKAWLSFGQGSNTSSDEEIARNLKKQVVRFLKPPDKYIALTSILLKSLAFHSIHSISETQPTANESSNPATGTAVLPVVEIPRTEYRKPYIPSKTKYDSFPPVNLYPFSISHQFPFVGMARLIINAASETPQNRPLVGLDIVTFDDYNPKLYDSVESFVKVFQSSFSPWEWECINAREDVILREFYLRWSIKEAYTKALGVGMGLSFESFETHFPGVEEKGIYAWLEEMVLTPSIQEEPSERAYFLQGTVVLKPNTPESKSEKCAFMFCPLWERSAELKCPLRMGSERGCACLCLVHSSLEKEEIPPFELATTWHCLEDLVEWHNQPGRQSS